MGGYVKLNGSKMKNRMFIMAFAIILVASCQVIESPIDDAPEDLKNYRTLTVGVSEEPDTRVGFDENNSFYWHKGDKVGVQTATGFKEMTLDDKYHGFEAGVCNVSAENQHRKGAVKACNVAYG